MINHRCRCRQCGTRRTLSKHPDHYVRLPKCSCSARNYRVDVYRQSGRENKKQGVCRCDGYHFPHRKGSLWCEHGHPTDEDYQLRYSCPID